MMINSRRSKKTIASVVLICMLLMLPIRTFAWGTEGHRMVAAIATQYLNPATKDRVLELVRYEFKTNKAFYLFEKKENPNSILWLVQKPQQILQYSRRLYTINKCLDTNNLNTMMATLICDTFQQEFFSKLSLTTLIDGFNNAISALYGNNNVIQPLQRIASIAFLKEFTKKFWNYPKTPKNY